MKALINGLFKIAGWVGLGWLGVKIGSKWGKACDTATEEDRFVGGQTAAKVIQETKKKVGPAVQVGLEKAAEEIVNNAQKRKLENPDEPNMPLS